MLALCLSGLLPKTGAWYLRYEIMDGTIWVVSRSGSQFFAIIPEQPIMAVPQLDLQVMRSKLTHEKTGEGESLKNRLHIHTGVSPRGKLQANGLLCWSATCGPH